MFAKAPDLICRSAPPTRPVQAAGMLAPDAARQRFNALNQTVLAQLDAQPQILETPATRTTLRSAILDAIMAVGEG